MFRLMERIEKWMEKNDFVCVEVHNFFYPLINSYFMCSNFFHMFQKKQPCPYSEEVFHFCNIFSSKIFVFALK